MLENVQWILCSIHNKSNNITDSFCPGSAHFFHSFYWSMYPRTWIFLSLKNAFTKWFICCFFSIFWPGNFISIWTFKVQMNKMYSVSLLRQKQLGPPLCPCSPLCERSHRMSVTVHSSGPCYSRWLPFLSIIPIAQMRSLSLSKTVTCELDRAFNFPNVNVLFSLLPAKPCSPCVMITGLRVLLSLATASAPPWQVSGVIHS